MPPQLLILFAFVASLSSATFAQSTPAQQSGSDPIRVSGLVNAQLRLTLGRLSSIVNLTDDLAGCTTGTYDVTDPKNRPSPTPLEPRVLDQVQRDARWYVVLQFSQQGNCNVLGRCGASAAVNLVWLELNAQLALLRKQSLAVESCMNDTVLTDWAGRVRNAVSETSTPNLELRNGVLLVSFQQNDYTNKVTTVSSLRYDRRAPEQGFKVSKKTFALK